MSNPASRKLFLLWLFAAFLAFVAVAVRYVRNGEVNALALAFAVIFVAMAFVTRSKNRGPEA